MEIIETYYDRCDTKTKRTLMGLTLHDGSGMRDTLFDNQHTKIFILKDKDFILGWALHSFLAGYYWMGAGTIMVYIRKKYRRCGYGTKLIDFAVAQQNKLEPTGWNVNKIRACGWNPDVFNFFMKANKNANMTVVKDYVDDVVANRLTYKCDECGALYNSTHLQNLRWKEGLYRCGCKNCMGCLIYKSGGY